MDRLREPLPSRVEGLPELPAEALAVLDAGLATLGLADLAEPARTALADHLRLLLAWNTAINLTAIRDPTEAVRRHVLDSLTAVPILRERGIDALVDLGSGGGFPGLPLAAVLPARRALLVESVAKKARFLEVAAGGRAWPAGSRRSPVGPRSWPPTAVTANAGRRSSSGRSAAWPSWPSWACRCSPRTGSSSPGSAATLRPSWQPPRTGHRDPRRRLRPRSSRSIPGWVSTSTSSWS